MRTRQKTPGGILKKTWGYDVMMLKTIFNTSKSSILKHKLYIQSRRQLKKLFKFRNQRLSKKPFFMNLKRVRKKEAIVQLKRVSHTKRAIQKKAQTT
jgi:ribosomal protein S8